MRTAPRGGADRRVVPVLVAVVSFALLLASGIELSSRVRDANVENPKPLFVFREPDDARPFQGRPVIVSDLLDESGNGTVTIRYGEESLDLRVAIPVRYPLPGLMRHADWLKIVDFIDASGRPPGETQRLVEAGELTPRRVAVTRSLPAGADPDTFGRIRRSDWVFDFYEFLPEGGFEHQRLRFPESARRYQARAGMAELRGEPVPERAADELRENTWTYQAALLVMPAGSAPRHTFTESALVRAGWTMPTAAASTLTLLFAVAWMFAPARRTHDRDEHARPNANP